MKSAENRQEEDGPFVDDPNGEPHLGSEDGPRADGFLPMAMMGLVQ